MNRARIILLTHGVGPYDYSVPDGMQVSAGSLVTVPLGPRKIAGVVWEAERFDVASISDNRLRPILDASNVPPLSSAMRKLVDWTADYYLARHADVLRMVFSSSAALSPPGKIVEYRRTNVMPERLTAQRSQALEAIDGDSEGDEAPAQGLIRELAERANVSVAVIRGLIKVGAFEPVEVSLDAPYPEPNPKFGPPELTEAQEAAAALMRNAVSSSEFKPYLLDGVTGSGKTETYFEAIAAALEIGKQTIVLLPEIALTQPMLKRFATRFGCEPVMWHSSLKSTERRRAWRAIADGTAKVVIGARSALFLPYANLGCIIVDEAHETSFKQEDGVRYHARDVAVMRGLFEKLPVVLASATPALESRHMVELGTYEELTLPSRFGPAKMPTIQAIDLTLDPPKRQSWIAPTLIRAMEETLERGEQALLFLNRRGYAPLTLCRTCGHRLKCPNCSAWMVEHRLVRRLSCHHCGHMMPPPEKCEECGEADSLVPCGPGVERIADEARRLFPEARIAIATSDTLWSPAQAAEFVSRVENKAVDIIVGTQLVTKGYHFPDLTLVGVIDADLGLEGGDLRASERTFQQISQVAGRAGRGSKPGHVYIQTRNPMSAVIESLVAADRDGFYRAEMEARRQAGAPPFGRLAGIIISSEDEREAIAIAREIGAAAPRLDDMVVLGPAPAQMAQLRGRYRQRLLVHARRTVEIQSIIRDWLGKLDFPRGVRVTVDVDPYNFM